MLVYMPTLPLPDVWEGNIEELVVTANALLPGYLPLKPDSSRTREEINVRLVRHYTTQGLLDEPLRVGREARYSQRHLLQLLALRSLMSDGLTAQALQGTLTNRDDRQLRELLLGERYLELQSGPPPLAQQPSPKPSNPALEYLAGLQPSSVHARQVAPAASAPPAFSPPAAPVSATLPTPRLYTRLELAPGIELHVDPLARLPRTPAELERLSRALQEALDSLAATRRHKK